MANYINNKEFHACMVEYKRKCDEAAEQGKPVPRLPKYFGEAITSIAKRYASKPNFSGYTYIDDMIGDGIMACIQYADRYDTTRAERLNQQANPLAYYTQIIHFAFLTRLQYEQKQQYIKALTMRSNPNIITSDEENYDSFDNVIINFERKLKEKKQKALDRKTLKEQEAEEQFEDSKES